MCVCIYIYILLPRGNVLNLLDVGKKEILPTILQWLNGKQQLLQHAYIVPENDSISPQTWPSKPLSKTCLYLYSLREMGLFIRKVSKFVVKKIPLVSIAKDTSLSLLGRTAWPQDSPSNWKPVIIQTKFSQSSTCDTWGQIILCCEGCPVYRRMFSSISGLYPPDASSTPFQGVITKNVPRHYQVFPGGQILV